MIPDGLLQEWWTGLDQDGNESSLFRAGWRGGPLGRMYGRSIDVLRAGLSRALPVNGVRASFASGADGVLEISVEVDRRNGTVERRRFRPPAAAMASVRQGEVTGAVVEARRARVAAALQGVLALDEAAATLDQTHHALVVIRLRRAELRERADAGADVSAELAELQAAELRVRPRHDALNVARKAALAAVEAV